MVKCDFTISTNRTDYRDSAWAVVSMNRDAAVIIAGNRRGVVLIQVAFIVERDGFTVEVGMVF